MSDDPLIEALELARRAEKSQALFYRALATVAESVGHPDLERLEELHADEQHHLSRLTARLLELEHPPVDLRDLSMPEVDLEDWESVARAREWEEIEAYEGLMSTDLDEATRSVVAEILECERHHSKELKGKWMMA